LHFKPNEDPFYETAGKQLVIDVAHSEEFMKEAPHSTTDTPLAKRHPFGKNPLSSSRKQRTEGTCLAAPLCV